MDNLLDFINIPIEDSAFAMSRASQLYAFEEKNSHVFDYFPHVVHQFQWFGLDTMEERAAALEHLGYMLLRLLRQMCEVYDMRAQQLCDEHCDLYEKWIRLIDKRTGSIGTFSDKAGKVLKSNSYSEPNRKEQQKALIEMYKQLSVIVSSHERISEERCNELDMRYSLENLPRVPMGDRKYFYLVLHFIALLTVPSHKDDSEQDFVTLFKKSFLQYCDSVMGRNIQETYSAQLADELADLDEEQQLETMRGYKKKLGAEIHEYLKFFGVDYCGINKDHFIGKLCKQLYECLNKASLSDGKRGEKESESEVRTKKMDNKELLKYFQKEVKMQHLIREIGELNKTIMQKRKSQANRESTPKRKENISVATGKKCSWTGIFIVDENKLASCFAKLYNYYFVQRKSLLEGKHDESRFFAYLFLLVEIEGLGKEGFADNSRRPFFEFIEEKVIEGNMEKTMRTFHNRVTDLLKLREQILFPSKNHSENQIWENNSDYKNFHGIRGIFHKSRYFKELEILKSS